MFSAQSLIAERINTPRDIETRKSRHIILAVLATLFAAALWFVPLPLPAFVKPFLVIVVAMLPIAGIVAFTNVFLLCLLFIIFSFFRIHEAFPQIKDFKIPLLLALSTLAMLGWNLFMTRALRPFWVREFTPFMIFFGIVTISMPFATNFGMAFAYWNQTYIKIMIMVFAIAWLVRRPKDFMIASRAFIIAGIVIGIKALSNKAAGIGLVEGTRVTIGRDIRSILGDPNDLSLVLMFPISFAVALIMARKNKWDKLLGLVGTGIMIAAVIATQSRGGLLGIVAVFGIVGNRYVKNKMLLGAIGAIGLIALVAMAGISDRSSGGAAEEGVDASAQSRLHSWETAWYMAVKNPLTGVGLDNFIINYFYYTKHWDGKPHAVHSTWMGVLADTGFLGFAAFMTMIVMTIRSNITYGKMLRERRAPNEILTASLALLAGMTGVCVSGTFLTQGFTWPLYILVALTAALSKYAQNFEVETQAQYDAGVFDPPPIQQRSKNAIWGPSKQDVPTYRNDDPTTQNKKNHCERMLWVPEKDKFAN